MLCKVPGSGVLTPESPPAWLKIEVPGAADHTSLSKKLDFSALTSSSALGPSQVLGACDPLLACPTYHRLWPQRLRYARPAGVGPSRERNHPAPRPFGAWAPGTERSAEHGGPSGREISTIGEGAAGFAGQPLLASTRRNLAEWAGANRRAKELCAERVVCTKLQHPARILLQAIVSLLPCPLDVFNPRIFHVCKDFAITEAATVR